MEPLDMRGGELDRPVQACREFVVSPKGGLYLFGPYGCGKTLLAGKVLWYSAKVYEERPEHEWRSTIRPPHMRIESVPALLSRIRMTYGGEGSAEAVINEFRFGGIVALDDIGAEKPSEWVQDVLFQIVDWRYGHDSPTVFTSNLHPGELAGRLGDRIAERILEMCKGRIVEIRCGSYRG